MAYGAVIIHQVCMPVKIRSFYLAMAADAGGPDRFFAHQFIVESSMGLMAIGTERFILYHRMMAGEPELRFLFPMALETHIFNFLGTCDQIGASMDIMAWKT